MTKSTSSLSTALSWAAIGLGAASALAPRAFASSYGLDHSSSTHVMLRLFGTRNVALGALGLLLDEDARATMAPITAAMNAMDALLIATASDHPGASRAMGAVSSLGFAAGFAYVATQ